MVAQRTTAASCELDGWASFEKCSSSTSARCSISFLCSELKNRHRNLVKFDNFDTVMIARAKLFSGKGNCSPLCTLVIDSPPPHKVNYTLRLILRTDWNPNYSSRYAKLYTDLVDHSPWIRAWYTSVLSKEDRSSWENKRTCPSC